MATQCRSSKCTAERKGFRRELDSWRHKLIHCVGFESVLEGIYGPRLLQDLNIFDECEPEAVDDWSVDANCAFCNLQLEKLNDHSSAVVVPGSPTSAETPSPQGLSISEKLQCQADRFLHAIFRKKEFPQSCDSSIPLVAQELMHKMIRRFALEYASKSQAHEGLNGLSDNSEHLPQQPDPDGPLDLTVSRASQALQQVDGVLDLSKKNPPSENASIQQKVSGSLGPNEEDQPRLGKKDDSKAPKAWKVTVLEKILSSFCSRHRLLLYHILMDMQEDYDNSVTLRDVQRRQFKAEPLCCHADKKLLNDSPTLALNDCSVTAGTCCRSCRFSTCTIPPICVCLKNIHSHSCQNIAVACVGQVTCSNPTVCCTHSRIPPRQYQQNGDHTYICCTRGATQNNCNSHNGCRGSRSPSPPPLSPKPVDTEGNMTVKTSIFHIQDCKTLNIAPPPLLPHRTEDEDPAWHSNAPIHAGCPECDTVVMSHTQADKENDQCGSLIGDLMERVTEKLRSIQPSEREQSLASQISKTRDDTHLTEIITTVLHNSSDKDYNLNDLLQQHVATGSPQTRSRRRLDTLESMSKSPDLRRQSLQIKRDFARLSPSSPFRRKMESERERCPKTIKPSTHSAVEQPESRLVKRESETVNTVLLKDSSGNLTTQNDEVQNYQEAQPHDDVLTELPSPNERTEVQATDCRQAKTKRCEEGILTVQVGRSRRNIVPPQRFSSYVTEPRKMYFAACFSESIFVKHSPEDSTSTALRSTEETVHPSHTCDKRPFIPEDRKPSCDVPQNIALPKDDILCKNETICERENDERSPRKRKSPQNSISPSKRSKHSLDTVSTSPTETVPNSTTTESVQHAKESQRGLKYDSPIKLMFVSSETGEDGVKYTLKAATSGSNSQDTFDPCMESSWAGSVIKKRVQDSVIETAPGRPEGSPTEVVTPITLLPSCSNSESENLESIQIANQTSPVKRRPGRPKKLGPHIVKSVKRPIGRPPKPKMTDSVSTGKTGPSAVDHRATEISRKDDGNKNLKITIVYGRSRRVRRVVSEDFGHLSAHQNDCEVSNGGKYSKLCSEKETSNDQITKEQLKDLHFVMPVEDKKCTVSSSCNIKCQRQSDVALSRKPGRPPKVKISGISVTVSSESPRQRRIHMKRDTKDLHLLRRTLFVEFQPSKEQKTINNHTDIHKDELDAPEKCSQNPRWSLKPVRHSVRERKPSIHLLHSVATARSCALVRRSRKLLLNKASSEASHPTGSKHEDPPNNALSKKTENVSSMQDIARFSTVSVNPIFSLNDGFRWWPTSALPETLNQELSRRIRLMSNTWVSDVLEANKAELKASRKPKTYNGLNGTAKKSAVKKLFDKNYDIEKLCTWFMQTTETQSLAIAKKASVKNPKEVFHYNPSRPNYKVNTCPSPQAERLRKHVKKFAKVVPKSPTMHKQAQEMLHRARMSQAKRKLFKTKPFKLSNDIGQRLSRSRGTWIIYRTTLLRARLKFQTRSRKTIHDKAHKIFSGQMGTVTSGAHTIELLKEMHSFVNKTRVTKVRNALKPSLKYPGVVRTSWKMLWNLKKNRIGCKAWSPESLKDCRVFLKKINSPNTKSTTEECNNCTVMCSDGSSEQENERNRDIVVRGALKSPVLSSPKCTGRRKRIKRKRYSTSPSPPAKMLRLSRSSRGVLGARWCDFVLGSLK